MCGLPLGFNSYLFQKPGSSKSPSLDLRSFEVTGRPIRSLLGTNQAGTVTEEANESAPANERQCLPAVSLCKPAAGPSPEVNPVDPLRRSNRCSLVVLRWSLGIPDTCPLSLFGLHQPDQCTGRHWLSPRTVAPTDQRPRT